MAKAIKKKTRRSTEERDPEAGKRKLADLLPVSWAGEFGGGGSGCPRPLAVALVVYGAGERDVGEAPTHGAGPRLAAGQRPGARARRTCEAEGEGGVGGCRKVKAMAPRKLHQQTTGVAFL